MKTGDIILIPFPFTDLTNVKVRPAVIASLTKDTYKDIIICAISSVIPKNLSDNEFKVIPNSKNSLRRESVVKVDRIVTLKRSSIIHKLGSLTNSELELFKNKFKALVD